MVIKCGSCVQNVATRLKRLLESWELIEAQCEELRLIMELL